MSKDDKWSDRRELTTSASPEQAWAAFANPEIITGWFADRAFGSAETGSSITHVFADFGMEMPYQVIEAIPGEKIVFEAIGFGGQPFRQEILVRRDGGQTVLELVHSGFGDRSAWGDEFKGVDSGWKLALPILRHYLEHFYGRPRSVLNVLMPAPFDFARADAIFREPDGLGRWLTDGQGGVGEVGSPVRLTLQDGTRVTGEVLAWSGHEAALTWTEIDGTLELKAFGAGPRTMVGVRAMSWAESPARDAWKASFGPAVARLVSVCAA